jgi:hypothetical protein
MFHHSAKPKDTPHPTSLVLADIKPKFGGTVRFVKGWGSRVFLIATEPNQDGAESKV